MGKEFKNLVYDTDYTDQIKKGGYPVANFKKYQQIRRSNSTMSKSKDKNSKSSKNNQKKGLFDKVFEMIFPKSSKNSQKSGKKGLNKGKKGNKGLIKDKSLKKQVQYILNLEDEKYNNDMLTPELRKFITKSEEHYRRSLTNYKSHIAPSYWETKGTYFNVSGLYGKTYYVNKYPSNVDFLWTRDVLSFNSKWDMSWFLYPTDDNKMKSMLKKRATALKSQISEATQKGITVDTDTELKYKDIESIRQKLATREERYFEGSYYCSIYADDEEGLKEESKKFEQRLGGHGIKVKPAIQRMDEGFTSTSPQCVDDLGIYRSMVTTSLAGSFPFISNDLIESTGILYGINQHTGSLAIFDRFGPSMSNYNSVVLATSGAGKSFGVKLEILRYMLLGRDAIVIDPENEYKSLIDKVGGTYVNIAVNSNQYLNPFDLPPKIEDIDYGKGDLLRSKIMDLIGLISVLVGGLDAQTEALLDKALQATYEIKGITFEDENPEGKEPPLMEDLLHVLEGMEGGKDLAMKLSKYVTGTFGNLFNKQTNVDLESGLTVFSIRDLEEALKTPAMYNILNFIWAKVRAEKKKRMLVVDEAWIMLQHEASANFLFGLIKRARKYGLGITTISQDIEDFIRSKYGKPIISNSGMQLLLKQSPSSIDGLEEVFGLSDQEQERLVSASVGEGIFMAGHQHVAIKILASPQEERFITTDVD